MSSASKFSSSERNWLNLCSRAAARGADVIPKDGRQLRTFKQLEVKGLLKRDRRGIAQLTKSGRAVLVAMTRESSCAEGA